MGVRLQFLYSHFMDYVAGTLRAIFLIGGLSRTCITCLGVEEIATEVAKNMFMAFIIILYQHHSDGTRSCS